MFQSLMVVEDFFDSPMELRKPALEVGYPGGQDDYNYPGRNSCERFVPPGLDRTVSDLVRVPLRGARDPQIAHGSFRLTLAGDTSRRLVHADPTTLSWVGLTYLTLPDDCQGGTAFYRHKGLSSGRLPKHQDLLAQGIESIAALLQRDGNDPSAWEHLMTVPMRFNRLLLYRPWLWHAAGEAFDRSREDGRLVYLVFFESAGASRQGPGG